MLYSFILLVVLLCCSAYLSGSETALFGLSTSQLHYYKTSPHRLQRMVAELMAHPRRVLLTILIGNTTVNVLIFATGFVLSERIYQTSPLLGSLWGVATVVLVIVFSEVLAKIVAMSLATQLAPWTAPGIKAAQVLFMPVRIILDYLLVIPINRFITGSSEAKTQHITIDELKALVDISKQRGIIELEEKGMLEEVVALSSIKVQKMMIPRVDMSVFEASGTREQLVTLMREKQLTKVPIYREQVDDLLGIIHARDVHLSPTVEISELLKPARFVPEQMSATQLISHFQQTETQLAIVVDEYGGVAGLVTLEDVVEQIVGDIGPRRHDGDVVERIEHNTYRMAGDVDIEPWLKLLGINRKDYNVVTMGGLVSAHLGRLAAPGDELHFGNVRVVVERVHNKRVQWVRVDIDDPEVETLAPTDSEDLP